MPLTLLYIATSLDGFIARPDGNLDWLTATPPPANGSDYGYADLLNRVGTVVMGRSTYEEILGFGVEWPYAGKETWVLSSNPNLQVKTPNTRVYTGKLQPWMAALKQQTTRDIWIVGGGQLIASLLEHDLLDAMVLTLIPITIGTGIPLFPAIHKENKWWLQQVESFDTGVVMLTYNRIRE